MEAFVASAAKFLELLVDVAAVLVVAYGAFEAFVTLLSHLPKGRRGHGARKAVWWRFGTWLLLGLEFELAADIIASIVTPSWQEIGQLGAIAVIRTFLNFFLEHDLEKAGRPEEA